MCVFITAVPNTKLCVWGEEDSGRTCAYEFSSGVLFYYCGPPAVILGVGNMVTDRNWCFDEKIYEIYYESGYSGKDVSKYKRIPFPNSFCVLLFVSACTNIPLRGPAHTGARCAGEGNNWPRTPPQ
jgi:hypothetical protein